MPFTLGIPAILLIGWTANKKNNSWSHSHISHTSMYMHTVQTIKVILQKKKRIYPSSVKVLISKFLFNYNKLF